VVKSGVTPERVFCNKEPRFSFLEYFNSTCFGQSSTISTIYTSMNQIIMVEPVRDALEFPLEDRVKIDEYLLQGIDSRDPFIRPHVTLTFATSLDSQLSLAPGVRTTLSGPRSKAMTHYLRSKHGAILIGVGTAIADDPGLNCRLLGVGGYGGQKLENQPRPIILDPWCRWNFTESSKVLQLAREGKGLPPYVIIASRPPFEQRKLLEKHGGKYIEIELWGHRDISKHESTWLDIFSALKREKIESVMIEGGGKVINSLLEAERYSVVDSVIVTIAPTWLGRGGVVVCPERSEGGASLPVARLSDVVWQPLGEDIVLCGRLASNGHRIDYKTPQKDPEADNLNE
jgi:2,5-diamino-6-(ribosylamino)-4(3H)-pyrimidinone 5'-phosphate reductase